MFGEPEQGEPRRADFLTDFFDNDDDFGFNDGVVSIETEPADEYDDPPATD